MIATVFLAVDAFSCLKEVPFNASIGTQFVRYYRDTLQFQSTLAYLKNPPASYQQPATDLLAALDLVQSNINNGSYTNEYDFENDLQTVIYSAHDSHLSLNAGALAVFTFGSQYALSSVSVDGIEPPKVYLTGNLLMYSKLCMG